jgi:hypothetical protein
MRFEHQTSHARQFLQNSCFCVFVCLFFSGSFAYAQQFMSIPASGGPLSCKFSSSSIKCTANFDNVTVDNVHLIDDLSPTCKSSYLTTDEKQRISSILNRLSPQEKSSLERNPMSTAEFLITNKRFSLDDNFALMRYVTSFPDPFFHPLKKGASFELFTQSCPSLSQAEFTVNREVYTWLRE